MITNLLIGASALVLPATAFAGPVEVSTSVMAEQRQPAPDGTVRIALVSAARVTPGDAVVYRLGYRNNGAQPAGDLVLANPIPSNLSYAGPAEGSPAPELSVDGVTFAPLSALQVRGADGAARAATLADVRVVRWRLSNPVAAGGHGQVAFRATVK